jgi:ABC-type multidrug transport system fused ATPase/permease subunit
VLVIAHRLSTLRGCGKIVELVAPGAVRAGSYSAIVGARSQASLDTQAQGATAARGQP